jgi:hypothetical protein
MYHVSGHGVDVEDPPSGMKVDEIVGGTDKPGDCVCIPFGRRSERIAGTNAGEILAIRPTTRS